jgi:GT2 family glycosyltransferase
MSRIKISYIVSTFNNPDRIPCLLWSLKAQTDQDFEVIITDNSDAEHRSAVAAACSSVRFKNYMYLATARETCFHSAEIGVQFASGEFVCFPSDDGYIVPTFGETMYRTAIETPADLVMCSLLYDPRCGHGRYTACPQKPERFWFDKTGFILRRDKFQPFPEKRVYEARSAPIVCTDGLLAEKLVAEGVSWVSIPDILVVHN